MSGFNHRAVPIEQIEVEGKAHAERVDAGAAGNEQASADLLQVEMSETEEAGAERRRHSNLAAENRGDGETAQVRS